jgi:superfamily II DNA or RNA helicase
VLMVSEGVDIPRLRVGVYATPARTELFFRQVVGRFIRRTPSPRSQMSYLLMPADFRLKRLAVEIEEERRHALEMKEAVEAEDVELDELPKRTITNFEALSSTGAMLDEAILTETTMQLFPTGDDPAPVPIRAVAPAPPPPAPAEPVVEAAFVTRERLRGERSRLVALVSRKTREEHKVIHGRINRATGVKSVSGATREQLEKGNALLERELSGR